MKDEIIALYPFASPRENIPFFIRAIRFIRGETISASLAVNPDFLNPETRTLL